MRANDQRPRALLHHPLPSLWSRAGKAAAALLAVSALRALLPGIGAEARAELASSPGPCQVEPGASQARIRMTDEGLASAVRYGLARLIPTLRVRILNAGNAGTEPEGRLPAIALNADPSRCSDAQVTALKLSEAWKICPGLPLGIVAPDDPRLKGWSNIRNLVLPEPSRTRLEGAHISRIGFDPPQVQCASGRCDITISLNELSVAARLEVKPLNSALAPLIVKDLGLGTQLGARPEARVKLKLRMRLEANPLTGELKPVLESVNPEVPPGVLGLGLDLNEEQARALVSRIRRAAYEKLRAPLGLPRVAPARAESLMQQGLTSYLKTPEQARLAAQAVNEQAMRGLASHFNSPQAEQAFLTLIPIVSPVFDSPMLLSMLQKSLTPHLAETLTRSASRTFSTMPGLGRPLAIGLPVLRINDELNLPHERAAAWEATERARKLALSPSDPDSLWREPARVGQLLELYGDTHDPVAARLLQDLAETWGMQYSRIPPELAPQAGPLLDQLRAQLLSASRRIEAAGQADRETALLRVTALTASRLPAEAGLGLSACLPCRGQVRGAVSWPADLPGAAPRAPVTMDVSLATINAYFEDLYRNGMLDFCLSDDKYHSCTDTDRRTTHITRFAFMGVPSIHYDPVRHSLFAEIPQLNLNRTGIARLLGGTARGGRFYFELKPTARGDGIAIDTTDLDTHYKVNDTNAFTLAMGVLRAPIAEIAENLGVTAYRHKLMDALSMNYRPPLPLQLSRISASPTAVTFEGQIGSRSD